MGILKFLDFVVTLSCHFLITPTAKVLSHKISMATSQRCSYGESPGAQATHASLKGYFAGRILTLPLSKSLHYSAMPIEDPVRSATHKLDHGHLLGYSGSTATDLVDGTLTPIGSTIRWPARLVQNIHNKVERNSIDICHHLPLPQRFSRLELRKGFIGSPRCVDSRQHFFHVLLRDQRHRVDWCGPSSRQLSQSTTSLPKALGQQPLAYFSVLIVTQICPRVQNILGHGSTLATFINFATVRKKP